VKHARAPRVRRYIGSHPHPESAVASPRERDAWAKDRERTQRWRRERRLADLHRLAKLTANTRWSGALLAQLVDELDVNDVFVDLVGNLEDLPVRRYPQAVTIALALRHSWRRDDLIRFAKRLGISLGSRTATARHSRARRVFTKK
jgi:hypothetical protein